MSSELKRKPELLIPASSLEVLKTAVIFGADAVYIGGEAFGLRAKAKNFSMEEMAEGIAFAHERGVKVYVTANILAHNSDLEGAENYFRELRDLKPAPPDALIISDPGMFAIAKEVWPQAEIHISTQANNTNYRTYLFWWKLGAKRVVSARELSLEEIREIRKNIPEEMEIESFVHGAMCISYSGRCLLSNYFTGRDANRGACTHPCRWKYAVVEETRPGEYLPVYENERGTFIFNSKDLCMIEYLPELMGAGIDSLKIEGRMKTALYVAAVARTYRKAIDDCFASETVYRSRMEWYRQEIAQCTYRQFTTGFYFGKPNENTQIYDNSTYISESVYLGIVEEKRDHLIRIEQKNKFSVGDRIEIMKPSGENVETIVEEMYNGEGEAVESCPHAKQVIWLKLSEEAQAYDLLRAKAASCESAGA
ncbi:MAG: U32 family peptidase [Lachnospiraceae bacterium]|nr:U32 family peptidase [Lachnospiraceae bacterium]